MVAIWRGVAQHNATLSGQTFLLHVLLLHQQRQSGKRQQGVGLALVRFVATGTHCDHF